MTFYVYDPGADEYAAYQSLGFAMREARSLIDTYRDDCDPEWPEYVDGIVIYESDNADEPGEGRMVARSVICDRIAMPDDVDEDGYSPSLGLDFGVVEFYCDYKMEAV